MIKLIRKLFYDWTLIQTIAREAVYHSKEETIRNLVIRIPIDRLKKHIQEAEKSWDKYTTLARLLEENYTDTTKKE